MSRKPKATKPSDAQRGPPSVAEAAAISEASFRVRNRKPRLQAVLEQSSAGRIEILGPAHDDRAGWLARLQDAFGSQGTAFAILQLNRLIAVARSSDGKIEDVTLNGMLAMVEGATPQNEVQAALAVQMAITHSVAVHVLARAAKVDQIPQFDSASNAAVKLLRTFTLQAETLAKLQRGGEQIVKVVHVHPGGQAIVGNVVQSRDSSGGGGDGGRWNQPHAKAQLPAAGSLPLPQMWSEDAERVSVPLAGREG